MSTKAMDAKQNTKFKLNRSTLLESDGTVLAPIDLKKFRADWNSFVVELAMIMIEKQLMELDWIELCVWSRCSGANLTTTKIWIVNFDFEISMHGPINNTRNTFHCLFCFPVECNTIYIIFIEAEYALNWKTNFHRNIIFAWLHTEIGFSSIKNCSRLCSLVN